MPRLLAAILCALLLASNLHAVPIGEPADPKPAVVAKASDEGAKALTGFKLPPGIKAELVAAEPLVANPVAFTIDDKGRIWVCETFRQSQGVVDNRSHPEWVDDDLAAQTVEDRIAYYKKHLQEKAASFSERDDRIKVITAPEGNGQYTADAVFADRFNHLEEGTGAGVLVRGNELYYTNIPNLWKFTFDEKTLKATERKVLHTGYGVRTAFRGHDMHGLALGPDGKLYYSIGDRGLNVTQGDRHFVNPSSGAVLRCNLDGSDLEMICTGLRNPQELTFDDYGNLFTGDNNSDSGDRARWVYLVEGSDTGWRMEYQYLPDRGPFNREKLWHVFHPGQAVYIVPPIENVSSGPSGVCSYPGTGLAKGYEGSFFLCDFHGGAPGSGVLTFKLKPKGATFELVGQGKFWDNVLATDVDFGPDGGLYVSDWVNGWNGEGKGRIYKAIDPALASDPTVLEVKKLLGEGFSQRSAGELEKLLAHADRRVRLEAQFALVEKKAETQLASVAKANASLFARLHGIWGLGQLLRSGKSAAQPTLVALLDDKDAEVRAQAAKVLGDLKAQGAYGKLVALLKDENSRTRFFAAMSLGKLGHKEAVGPLLEMLAENADKDPVLRHGGIMGLVGTNDAALLAAASKHESPSVRLALVVALRKLKSDEVARFLNDSNELVVVEAARGIHDLPLPNVYPQLAALITRGTKNEDLIRRVLNTNFRLGKPENANALTEFAARDTAPDAMRIEAIKMLGSWAAPSPRDRVLGVWNVLPKREADVAAKAFSSELPRLFSADPKVRNEAARVATSLGIQDALPTMRKMFANKELSGEQRAEALTALAALKDVELDVSVKAGLTDAAPEVRAAARTLFARSKPAEAMPLLEAVLDKGENVERQAALDLLAGLSQQGVNPLLDKCLDKLLAGDFPQEARLDLLEAASRRNSRELQDKVKKYEGLRPKDDKVAPFREALFGGNAERGESLFFEKTEVSCVRCHKVGDRGGDVGPELTKIGSQKDRQYLLESICDPNRASAKGFETVLVVTDNGKISSGILKGETATELTLMTPEATLVTIKKETIEERRAGKSSMPDDLPKKLTNRELRDLVEYLATRK